MADLRYSAAGGVVVDDAGRVLILNRPVRHEVRLPKGHVEAGEDVEAAARRETAEESGYDDLEPIFDLGRQVVRFRGNANADDHVQRTERYFLYRLLSDHQIERPPKDAAQFEPVWLTAAEAVERLTYEAEREWVRRAVHALTGI